MQTAPRPGLYAHRLGRAYGPDSTAATLSRTLRGPVDGLETDVCLTADDELVLLHDPLLSLGTTGSGWAHERTAAAILDSRVLDRSGRPTRERPMLLEELLEAVPGSLTVQVEVKAHSDRELARRTAAAVCDRLEAMPRAELLSFHSAACEVAAERGISSRLVIFADYAPDALAAWAVRHGVDGVSVEHFMLSEQLVGLMGLAGISVNTGTVNDAETLGRALEFGPDAVCTDRPHELSAALDAAGVGARDRAALAAIAA